jgi:hypothetical protein
MKMARAVRGLLLALVATGCVTESVPAPPDECAIGQEREPYTLRCFPHSLSPVTDPESSEFGRVNCALIEVARAGSELCDCALPGYRPATSLELELARAELDSWGACQNACCEGLCYCVLAQLEGEELAACQGGDETRQLVDRSGWCYVEPDVGVGDPSTVEGCLDGERQLVLLTPIRANRSGVFLCETPAD